MVCVCVCLHKHLCIKEEEKTPYTEHAVQYTRGFEKGHTGDKEDCPDLTYSCTLPHVHSTSSVVGVINHCRLLCLGQSDSLEDEMRRGFHNGDTCLKRLTYVWVVEALHNPYLSKKLQKKKNKELRKLRNFIRKQVDLLQKVQDPSFNSVPFR